MHGIFTGCYICHILSLTIKKCEEKMDNISLLLAVNLNRLEWHQHGSILLGWTYLRVLPIIYIIELVIYVICQWYIHIKLVHCSLQQLYILNTLWHCLLHLARELLFLINHSAPSYNKARIRHSTFTWQHLPRSLKKNPSLVQEKMKNRYDLLFFTMMAHYTPT